jgi:hypothetical protein
MRYEKLDKWSHDARVLANEVFDLERFVQCRSLVYWAMQQHRGLSGEDGGVIVQGIIEVFEEAATLIVRRIVKPNDQQGGASLKWLLTDMATFYAIAKVVFPKLPEQKQLSADIADLDTATSAFIEFADESLAHVARRPKASYSALLKGPNAALETTLALGLKYLPILGARVPRSSKPTAQAVRELFAAPWISEDDAIPSELIGPGLFAELFETESDPSSIA